MDYSEKGNFEWHKHIEFSPDIKQQQHSCYLLITIDYCYLLITKHCYLHVDVWQKPSQFYKAIIPQFKK